MFQKASKDVWLSLSRYDDELVSILEDWEKRTRTPGKMGRRNPDAEQGEVGLARLFEDGKWDTGKMVKNFARFGTGGKSDVVVSGSAVSLSFPSLSCTYKLNIGFCYIIGRQNCHSLAPPAPSIFLGEHKSQIQENDCDDIPEKQCALW